MHVNCSSVKEDVGQIKNSQIFFLLVQAIHERLQKGPPNAFVKCFNIVHTFQTVLLMDRTRKKTSFYLILTPPVIFPWNITKGGYASNNNKLLLTNCVYQMTSLSLSFSRLTRKQALLFRM